MKRSVISVTGVILAMSMFLSGCSGSKTTASGDQAGQTQDKAVTLKLGHYFATDDFRGKTSQYFADLVEKKSNKNIKVQVFPSEQLVKGKEGFQSTVQGVVDMYPVLSTYAAGQIPIMNFFNLPLPPQNYNDDVMLKVINENKDLLGKIFDANGVKMLGTINSAATELYFRAPVHSLKDIQGMKLRGPGGLADEALNTLGASVTFLSAAEQYLALQTGTVDGVSTTYSSYISGKLNEVAPYWLKVTMTRSPYFLLMNQAKWKSLSPNQQKILNEAMEETTQWSFANNKSEEEKLMSDMRKTVKEEYSLDQAEWDRWYKKVEPLSAKFFKDAGTDAQTLMASREKLTK